MVRPLLLALPLSLAVSACVGNPTAVPASLATQTVRRTQGGALAGAADCAPDGEDTDPKRREAAGQVVRWHCQHHKGKQHTIELKVLGFNDFHGRLAEGSRIGGRPVGGAAVLASYLRAAQAGKEDRTLIIHAGDQVGATPPESALLHDEPSIQFLNLLTNGACRSRDQPEHCNVLGTLGNHEFDVGRDEMLRLLRGGNHASGPILQNPYPGALFPYVNANVFVEHRNEPLIAPAVIRELAGVRVGVIGAVLKQTPTMVTPAGVAGLEFRDEAASVNAQVRRLRRLRVNTIVVAIHQGALQSPSYTGPTDTRARVGNPISKIVSQLDDAVDLVVSGHSHSFTNALVPNEHGHQILVVQAFCYGTAYDDVDLVVDRDTGDVVSKSASIVTTYSDVAPGANRAADVQAIVDAAVARVAPLVNQKVATIASDIVRVQNAAGESPLGDLIADAERTATGSDFAFINPGGIRADLSYATSTSNPSDAPGVVLWGEVFSVQPFGNTLVRLSLTGQQIMDALNQQWATSRMLQISGLSYTWNAALAAGPRVTEVRRNGVPIDLAANYTVTVNSFLAGGGDGFSVFTRGTNPVGKQPDLDALVEYLKAQPQPIAPPPLDRIRKLD